MTNARPEKGTGAVVSMPGRHSYGTAREAVAATPAPRSLDPEVSFAGAVLHLPALAASAALRLVQGDDFAHPTLPIVLAAAQRLAGSGTDPDPVAVLALLRRDAVVTGASAISEVALLIVQAYDVCPVPASAPYYAAAVLAEAFRRRCTVLGSRLRQAAERDSVDSIDALLEREVADIRAVRGRLTAAERGQHA